MPGLPQAAAQHLCLPLCSPHALCFNMSWLAPFVFVFVFVFVFFLQNLFVNQSDLACFMSHPTGIMHKIK